MRQELFELGSEVIYNPDAVDSFLDALMEAMDTSLSVLLSVGRSDRNPEYQRVTHRGRAARYELGPLLGGSDVVLTWTPESMEPSTIESSELGADWKTLFDGKVLVLPLPGRTLGYKAQALNPLAGLLLIGPISEPQEQSSPSKDLLLATQLLLGVSLVQWERRDARRLLASKRDNNEVFRDDDDVQAFGGKILTRIRQVVDFNTGVLYLRGLPSRELSDYMVFAASFGEDPDALLHSYWAPEQLGITFKTMTVDKRTVSGKKMDMPEARRETNDSALQHVPGGVHGAWALMPFFLQERGVAVAHLEGLNEGRGITGTELEALQLLGEELGYEIHRWQQNNGNDSVLNCDLSLVEQLYEVERYSRDLSHKTESFQNVVERAFGAIPGVELLDPPSSVRTDLYFELIGGARVVVEATIAKDLTKKRRQLMEYVNELGADLGILVVSGEVNGTNPQEDLSAYQKMLLMDVSRLMRFICLSPKTRGELLPRWVDLQRNGMIRTPMMISCEA